MAVNGAQSLGIGTNSVHQSGAVAQVQNLQQHQSARQFDDYGQSGNFLNYQSHAKAGSGQFNPRMSKYGDGQLR